MREDPRQRGWCNRNRKPKISPGDLDSCTHRSPVTAKNNMWTRTNTTPPLLHTHVSRLRCLTTSVTSPFERIKRSKRRSKPPRAARSAHGASARCHPAKCQPLTLSPESRPPPPGLATSRGPCPWVGQSGSPPPNCTHRHIMRSSRPPNCTHTHNILVASILPPAYRTSRRRARHTPNEIP
jgi:hypothetical protein